MDQTAPTGKTYVFRDPVGVTTLMKWTLYVLIGVDIIGAFSNVGELLVLSAIKPGSIDHVTLVQLARIVDGALGLSSFAKVALAYASLIVFFIWVYRMSANLHAIGAKDLDTSPAFAVGMFFIPVANIFLVPVMLDELWRASRDPQNWKTANFEFRIGLWWAFQISTSVLAIIIGFTVHPSHDVVALQTTNALLLGLGVLEIVNRVLQLLVIGPIGAFQKMLQVHEAFS